MDAPRLPGEISQSSVCPVPGSQIFAIGMLLGVSELVTVKILNLEFHVTKEITTRCICQCSGDVGMFIFFEVVRCFDMRNVSGEFR